MKNIILFAAILVLASCANRPKWHQLEGYTFEKFIVDFEKDYQLGSQEYNLHKATFIQNLLDITTHNLSESSYKKGVNRFTDMTVEEFKFNSMGLKKEIRQASSPLFRNLAHEIKESSIDVNAQLPSEVDWRREQVVTPVKDQGQCGSCWAFSAVETLESHAAIAAGSGTLKTLSPQQLVSCSTNPLQCGGEGGCQGSVPELAFAYVSFYGLTSEYKYGYTSYYSGQNGECTINAATRRQNAEVTADGFVRLPVNDQQALLAAVAQLGPISVSIDASGFNSYESGVFDGCSYLKNIDINHGVNLVGYGTDPEHGDYWLIRNSWGTQWGEDGYMKLKRESKAKCGIDYTPLHGTVCAGQSKPQKVCGQCGVLSDSAYPVNVQVVG